MTQSRTRHPATTVADVVAALGVLGFVPAGQTREETVRIGTTRSPILGGAGGERRTVGGRARLALPGTDVRATVGARTTYLYRHAPGSRRVVEIAHLSTRDVTAAALADAVGAAVPGSTSTSREAPVPAPDVAAAALADTLARNPGATEASVRSYLRGEYGDSTAADRALADGSVVRRGPRLYLASAPEARS